LAYKVVPGRPPQDPWRDGVRVRDWEAWYDDAGLRFGWIEENGHRLGAITWVGDEVTQVLGLNADEPPDDASEAALMWVKPRVVTAYSFQPGLVAAARRLGMEPAGEVFQLRCAIAAGEKRADGATAVSAGDAETVGRLYDQVFRAKGGRRVVWQFFDRHESSRGWMWRHQGRGIGLYVDRVNPNRDVQVVWLGVLPDFRRQGFGRRLTEAGLANRAADGATQAVVQVSADNAAGLRLAEGMGFSWEWTRNRLETG
jgi:ribosomal protein S18 acetylase RimI-like enzyme